MLNKKNRRMFGYIRKLPSGRFQASYVGPDGTRNYAPRSFRAKQDANAFLSAVDVALSNNTWVKHEKSAKAENSSPKPLTMRGIYDEFIDYRGIRGTPLKASTQELYARTLAVTLGTFVDEPLDSITSNQVSDWYLSRVKTGKVTTASKGYKLLKAMLSYSVRRGYIATNPCDVPGAQSASTGVDINIPEPEQVLVIAKRMPDNLGFAVLLQAYGALRFEEWTELRRKDVEIYEHGGEEHLRLKIHRAVVRVGGVFIVGSPKSKMSRRTIEVTSSLIPLMREHLDNRVAKSPEALLFPLPGATTHLPHYVFMKRWGKALVASSIPRGYFRPHSLRHFGATEMMRQGANFAELKVWLGDSSLQALERYLHPTDRGKDLANSMRLQLGELSFLGE